MKSNQHKITMDSATNYVLVFIAIVVLFQVIASLFPTLVASGDTLNESGIPLGSL